MPECYVDGEYTCLRGQEYADFCIKAGFPADLVKKVTNTNWYVKICTLEDKKTVVMTMKCEEMPQVNTVEVMVDGVEQALDNPIFMGKAKVTINCAGPNKIKGIAKTEAYGDFEWIDEYTKEGVKSTMTIKGATVKEFWPRKVKLEGWYRFKRGENIEEYCKATGMPAGMAEACKTNRMGLSRSGDTWTVTDCFGTAKAVNSFKLDEEFRYKFPEYPNFERNSVVISCGPNSLKMIGKSDAGRTEEWTMEACADGCLWTGFDKATGQSCKMYMERFTNVFGEFRVVTTAGCEEFLKVMGMPSDMASKIANEKYTVNMMDKPGGVIHFKVNSQYMPMNESMRFDEEYVMNFPGMGEYRCLETLMGDTIHNVSKGPKFTTRSQTKFGDNFVVMTTWLDGTDIVYKAILERL